jgi:hypothetical protein
MNKLLTLALLTLSLASCQPANRATRADSPCRDAQFISLQRKNVGEMNEKEFMYYSRMKEECERARYADQSAENMNAFATTMYGISAILLIVTVGIIILL